MFMSKLSRVTLPLPPRRRRHCSQGALVVEMAICLPILVMLTFAIIEYGIVINATMSISQLTRDTARFVAVHGGEPTADSPATTHGSIKEFLQTECAGGSINYADLTLTVGKMDAGTGVVTSDLAASRAQGSAETVQLSYPLGKKIGVSTNLVPGLSAFTDVTKPYVKKSTIVLEKVPG